MSDERLQLSHDPEGNETVDFLGFRLARLQPPLFPRTPRRTIYVRNASDINLRVIEPCREIFANGNDNGNHARLGHMSADFFCLGNGEPEHLGSSCERGVELAPGQMVRADIHIHDFDPGLTLGDHPFTTVVGAVGQTPD